MSGGYGSGNTTSAKTLNLPVIKKASLIRDRSMDEDFEVPKAMVSASLQLSAIWSQGHHYLLYRPIELAFKGLLNRAHLEGRICPIRQTATAHWQAQDNVLKLHKHFGDQINIIVVNNSDQPTGPEVVDDPVDFLNSASVRYANQQAAASRIFTEFESVDKTLIPVGILAILEKDRADYKSSQQTSETEAQFWNKILSFFIDSLFPAPETD